MLQYEYFPPDVAYSVSVAVALFGLLVVLISCVRRYRTGVSIPTCGSRSSESVKRSQGKEGDAVCEARKANDDASDTAKLFQNPVLHDQSLTGTLPRRRLRHQEENRERCVPSDDHRPPTISVPQVASQLSDDGVKQAHLLNGNFDYCLPSLAGSHQLKQCPAKGVAEACSTSQKRASIGADDVAPCEQGQESDAVEPPPFDDEVMAALCPFGFGGKKLPGNEDDAVALSHPMTPPSSHSHRCPVDLSHGAGVHPPIQKSVDTAEVAGPGSDSSCRGSAACGGAGNRAQWLTATPCKEALRSIPDQLSDGEKEAEAAACKAQLSAILELMRKQDDVFSVEDIEGVSSQLKLYM